MHRLSAVVVALVFVTCLGGCRGASSPSSTVEPSPSFTVPASVAWSGTAANAACAAVANNWTWNEVVEEHAGGSGMTVDYVDATLDGVAQPRLNVNTNLTAKGKVTIARAFCLSGAGAHTAVDTIVASYQGRQSIDVHPVQLLAKP
jgi:hypothetical protein